MAAIDGPAGPSINLPWMVRPDQLWRGTTCSVTGPTPAKILYEISKSQNFWQDFGFLAFHFKDVLFTFVVLSLKH